MMKLYIDTADVAEWEALMPTGLFAGITTNPLLARRAGLVYPEIDWGELAARAADLGAKHLFAQVFGPPESYGDFSGALFAAGKAAGIATVVKLPLTEAGIRAVPQIRTQGPVMLTACYDPKQMFVATALGAEYIAPYFGRMLEQGHDAWAALAEMRKIGEAAGGRATGGHTRILVASIRDTRQLVRLGAEGQECFTLAPKVARALMFDPNTLAATEEFEAAARGGA